MDQKARFGPAAGLIPYVECDSRGPAARPDLCAQRDIRRYPTWIMGDVRHEGVLSLERLADISDFRAR